MKMILSRAWALAAAMMLLFACAHAQPRYPEQKGSVTDAAAVLSRDTAEDVDSLAGMLADEDILKLRVVTVDFLDGAGMEAYGEGLRDHWRLGKDDLLLVMAVGEDRFGFFPGRDVEEKLSSSVLDKLLAASFSAPFLRQEYDAAIASLMPALVTEISKGYHQDVSIAGLFGVPESVYVPDWFSRGIFEAPVREPDLRQRVTQEDEDTGLSLVKVILTVILLMIIFGNYNRRRTCCLGCGCAPLSSVLAALGLWRLWDKR